MVGDRIVVGDIEIIGLADAGGPFAPLEGVFPEVPVDQWPPYQKRYPTAFAGDAQDILQTRMTCYVIRAPGRTFLVDAGLGPAPPALFGDLRGTLLTQLQRVGVTPDAIDTVFLTHLHIDHVGWNVQADGTPTFPKARYVTSQTDWEVFQQPDVQALYPPYVDQMLTPLQRHGILDLIAGETPLAEGITAIPTPGHSPGHMSLQVVSRGEQILIGGDIFLHPAQVTEPTWSAAFDMDPTQASATRRSLLDWLVATGIPVSASHFPSPGFGRIVEEGDRRYWQPV